MLHLMATSQIRCRMQRGEERRKKKRFGEIPAYPVCHRNLVTRSSQPHGHRVTLINCPRELILPSGSTYRSLSR